ncbi:aldose epimerase [Humitalea sp. 24SJ18S-53]|uniref:aldose epimerase family protein n=1 Tax=Humitalea sp. 24SJ18S-53 TaxID=3422307 RepID=UPI003D669B49
MSLYLTAGGWAARLLPEQGAAMARLTCDGRDVLAPVPDGADPNTAMAGAFWMAPWTNRLDGGRVGALGTAPVNRPADGTAIHGFLRDQPWRVVSTTAQTARLTVESMTAPLPCRAVLDVALDHEGLSLMLALTNLGATALPFGIGWHPWFVRTPSTHLAFTATHRFVRDSRNLPDAVEPTAGIDGGEAALLGHDTHWSGWDGRARIDGFVLGATGAWAGNMQLYAPPHLPVLCVEPVSHVPDVLNRPRFAPYGAMDVLAPGDSMAGRITLLRAM